MKSRSRPIAPAQRGVSTTILLAAIAVAAVITAVVAALLVNIFERKQEAKVTSTRLVEVTRDTTDPAKWGVNWPKQYDGYKLTAQLTKTRFGGHGGSEALPQEKIDKDPWLKRMFLGYAFSIDYRDRRGHAYMLQDQENTQRQTKPQTGSCLHCHGSVMPLYRKLGDGDAIKGFETTYKIPYKDLNKQLHDMGHGFPVSCPDCHDPKTMQLIVTRPAFLQGIERLANSDAPTPFAPSIERWRAAGKAKPYDPNTDATPQRDAHVRLRPVPHRVLLLVGDAVDGALGQGPERRPDRDLLERNQDARRWPLLRLQARGDRCAHPEGPASRVRGLEPGRACAQRRGLRRLPHALCAGWRHQGVGPLGAQPAAEHQPGLPALPQDGRGRDQGARRPDPVAQLRTDAARRRGHHGA